MKSQAKFSKTSGRNNSLVQSKSCFEQKKNDSIVCIMLIYIFVYLYSVGALFGVPVNLLYLKIDYTFYLIMQNIVFQ